MVDFTNRRMIHNFCYIMLPALHEENIHDSFAIKTIVSNWSDYRQVPQKSSFAVLISRLVGQKQWVFVKHLQIRMTGNWKEKQKQNNDVFNHSIVITSIDNITQSRTVIEGCDKALTEHIQMAESRKMSGTIRGWGIVISSETPILWLEKKAVQSNFLEIFLINDKCLCFSNTGGVH